MEYIYTEFQRILAIRLDLASIGIMLSVLIVIFAQRKNITIKRIKKAFVINIIANLIIVSTDCSCWAFSKNNGTVFLYKVFLYINVLSIPLAFISVLYLVKNLTEHKFKFNKKLFNILVISLAVMGALLFIPSIRELIYQVKEDTVEYIEGTWFIVWFIILSVILQVGLVYSIIKMKLQNIRDSIIVFLYLIFPLVSVVIDKWWASTIGELFSSFALIILYGITYQNILKYKVDEINNQKVEIANMQTNLLLSQIHPHFIYNTINTLKYLCETNPQEASKLCDNFSGYLRNNIDSIEKGGVISIEEEVKNVENYLLIEKARFEERVNYKFDIKCKSFCVPVFCMQTLVENAVKHGICKKEEGGLIIVSTSEDEDNYIVKIIDDGVGYDKNAIANDGKTHIGIKNAEKRLINELNGQLIIDSTIGKGTTVTILIPKEE